MEAAEATQGSSRSPSDHSGEAAALNRGHGQTSSYQRRCRACPPSEAPSSPHTLASHKRDLARHQAGSPAKLRSSAALPTCSARTGLMAAVLEGCTSGATMRQRASHTTLLTCSGRRGADWLVGVWLLAVQVTGATQHASSRRGSWRADRLLSEHAQLQSYNSQPTSLTRRKSVMNRHPPH